MDGNAGFPITQDVVAGGNFTAMGTGDIMSFPSTGTPEFYYIVAPDGLEDLTSVTPQHLVDGGIDTNAVQRKSFNYMINSRISDIFYSKKEFLKAAAFFA